MVNSVSKIELVLLSFNVTAYKIAKELPAASPFFNEAHYKGTSFLLILIVEYGLFDFTFGRMLKMGFHFLTLFIVLFVVIHLLLDIIYEKKIKFISESYRSYYNMLFPFIFVLFSIAGFAYIFFSNW